MVDINEGVKLTFTPEQLNKIYDVFLSTKESKDSYERAMRDPTLSVESRAIQRDKFLKSEAFMYGIEFITDTLNLEFAPKEYV